MIGILIGRIVQWHLTKEFRVNYPLNVRLGDTVRIGERSKRAECPMVFRDRAELERFLGPGRSNRPAAFDRAIAGEPT
jgi:hypothetical protein